MNTPICDFVRNYANSQPMRLHMPGHKGKAFLGMEQLDITEIPGADVLYHADGIILESEQNASMLFGSGRTFYSTEGSSLPIRAMLYLVCQHAARQGSTPLVAAGRNAHKVFITAAALLNLQVDWLAPEQRDDLISCVITPEYLDDYLNHCRELPTAVYITSPDYLGTLSDIGALAAVCHAHGCLLLVDNAHGAYLHFLREAKHPMDLGADLCCDSAHKTLPVLTGGAYLHIGKAAPPHLAEAAEQALALFASTSPSYLILQSLDQANAWMADDFAERLSAAAEKWDSLKNELQRRGFQLAGDEPLKLTVLPKPYGYTGDELASILESKNIFCEFADPDHLVLMLPAEVSEAVFGSLLAAFASIPQRSPILAKAPILHRAEQVISPHAALFGPSCEIDLMQAAGRVMAAPSVSCPPAIPVVACGERIEPWAIDAMAYYGITRIRVTEKSI